MAILLFVIMNILDMWFKSSRKTKWQFTKVTIKIFRFFMNSFDMSIKITWLANNDVFAKNTFLGKEFVTGITFVILYIFMFSLLMCLLRSLFHVFVRKVWSQILHCWEFSAMFWIKQWTFDYWSFHLHSVSTISNRQ